MLYQLVCSDWAILSTITTYLVVCQHRLFFTISATSMMVAAHTTWIPWTYTKILHVRLYNNMRVVDDVLVRRWCVGYTLFITPMMFDLFARQRNHPPSQYLPFNLSFWSEYHYETMDIHYIIAEAMEDGLWTRGIGVLLTELWSKWCIDRHIPERIATNKRRNINS